MIAAGVNAKALSSFMGHSSIETTFDRMATSCREARARQLSKRAYLERAAQLQHSEAR